MTATVNDQSITITDESLTVSESVGIYECDFTFDASWDEWNKTAVFEGAGSTIEMIVVDNKAQIPWEVLKEAGWIKIGVYGTKGGEIKPTIWSDQIYVAAGTVPGSVETTPTPSIYAQILALANEAKDAAEDAEDAANDAKNTADGVADDWAAVTASAITLAAGSSATATFANNNFAFGIPKGDTGATGAKGDKGDKGDTGATGAKGDKGDKGDNGDVTNIADAYSTSATYALGDYCIYNSQLYRCTTAITTAEAWTAAHWTAVQLGDDTSTLRSALNASIYSEYMRARWVIGYIKAATGIDGDNSARLRTDFLPITVNKIVPLDGAKFCMFAYQMDGTYVGIWNGTTFGTSATWWDAEIKFGSAFANYQIRLTMQKADGSDVAISDSAKIKIYEFINNLLPGGIVTYPSLENDIKNGLTAGLYQVQEITYGQENRYINPNNGIISDAGASNVHVSDYLDCSNIKYIRYTGSPYYSFSCIGFYDSDKAFIRAYPASSSNKDYWMEEVPVPQTAKYVVLGNNSAISGKLPVTVEFMTSYGTASNRKWVGKKWTCVGDSLTEINDRASQRYLDYIQIDTGIKPYNMGLSGTGYANKHAQGNAFIDRIVNVPLDSDVVTIFGSFNDVFSSNPIPLGDVTDTGTSTLCGFINGTIDALYTTFPQAQLGVITPCPWENTNPSNTTSDASKYVQAIIDICKLRGIACLDLFHCSGMRPWEDGYKAIYYTNDDGNGVHPNNLGHKIIAAHVNAFLETLVI